MDPNIYGDLQVCISVPLSDSNKVRTHNHLVCQRALNHIAKLAKLLSCVASAYLHGAFDCVNEYLNM